MSEHLGIEWMEVGDDYLKAKMPVDHRTVQPYGLLHGGATGGFVTGVATPIHLGKSTQVWDIRICNENEKLVCVSRLTVAIIPKRDFSKPRSL